ncbi:MAG: acylphosphatase [Candidatus Babeliaceae bacterium]
MNKCLKIIFSVPIKKNFLQIVIQKLAQDYRIEGSAQIIEQNKVKVLACGAKDNVESFLDALHKEAVKHEMHDIEIEPFLKEKDYRGVFRIIE